MPKLPREMAFVGHLRRALQHDQRADTVDLLCRFVDSRAPVSSQRVSLSIAAAHNGELILSREAVDLYVDVASGDPTAEPEQWTRTILAHCRLAEEPQVFAPHENRRAVMTTSVMQVRKPINRAGIGSAEPYREFLQPFIEAYYG